MSELRPILQQTGQLIEAIGRPAFAPALGESIDALAPIDSFLVLAYRARQTPVILHDGLRPEERQVFDEHYLNGAYLLSPFYQACMAAAEPEFYLISEIAPDGFYDSEFCHIIERFNHRTRQAGLANSRAAAERRQSRHRGDRRAGQHVAVAVLATHPSPRAGRAALSLLLLPL